MAKQTKVENDNFDFGSGFDKLDAKKQDNFDFGSNPNQHAGDDFNFNFNDQENKPKVAPAKANAPSAMTDNLLDLDFSITAPKPTQDNN